MIRMRVERLAILAAVAALAGCEGSENAAYLPPLETALENLRMVRMDLTTPEGAVQTFWRRQDARAVARCETIKLRRISPASWEGQVIDAVLGHDMGYADLYAGDALTHLDLAAAPPAADCETIVDHFDRRFVQPRATGRESPAQVYARIYNVAPIPASAPPPTQAQAAQKGAGLLYRYSLIKDGDVWKITAVEEMSDYDVAPRHLLKQTAPPYPYATSGI